MTSVYCKEVQTPAFRYCRILVLAETNQLWLSVTYKNLKYGLKTCCNWPCRNATENGSAKAGGDTLGTSQTSSDKWEEMEARRGWRWSCRWAAPSAPAAASVCKDLLTAFWGILGDSFVGEMASQPEEILEWLPVGGTSPSSPSERDG